MRAEPPAIGLRPLRRSDFALLAHWLQAPHVARWWADDSSPEAIEADYGGCIDGTEPAEVFIACIGDAPLGLVQRYALASYPQYLRELAPLVPVPPDTWSIDYLVGEHALLRHGLGTAMVTAFTRRLWQDQPSAASVLVPVHAANRASWRVLERAGYRRVASGELEPDNPADSRDHHLYVADRD